MLAWLAPILVFGLVVFVHELGHFLAAKVMGVYAPRFSIGFGPALWRKRWGETEYVIAALPLGGYVRMASREDEAAAILEGGTEEQGAKERAEKGKDFDPEAMIPFGPKPVPEHRWFESKPLWQRLVILIAGVTMNALLALVVAIGLAMHYGRPVVPTRVVGAVNSVKLAPALTSALQPGDTLAQVEGMPVQSWNDVRQAILDGRGDTIEFVTHRGPAAVPITGGGRQARADVADALEYYVPAVVDSVVAGQPAARAGMLVGDSVAAIDGTPIRNWSEFVERVQQSPGAQLVLSVVRGGELRQLAVVPESSKAVDPVSGKPVAIGRVGIAPRDVSTREPLSMGEAVTTGWTATWVMGGTVLRVLRQLVTGQVSVRNLGGPIAIAKASVSAAQRGPEWLFNLLAFLSINVAVFNLLPIPILDGGQIVLNVVEAVRGRALSDRTREYILRVGLLAIALLFALVMFNDLGLWRLLG